MSIAQMITAAAHPSWRARLEVPIAPGDPRAADLVMTSAAQTLHVEIERALVDFQAQLRSAQIKREAIAGHDGRPVRLVIAVPDSKDTRARLAPYSHLLAQTMPATSREICHSIRTGEPISGDGILFVRSGARRG